MIYKHISALYVHMSYLSKDAWYNLSKINLLHVKLFNLNFYSFELESRYRDPWVKILTFVYFEKKMQI